LNRNVVLLSLALALAAPGAALASGPDLGQAVQDAKPDTSKFLPRWIHASLGAGISWMQAPSWVRVRYGPGIALTGNLWASLLPGARLAVELEYLDLPANTNGFATTYKAKDGSTYTIPYDYYTNTGAGNEINGLAVLSFKVWRNLWVEGGVGGGHFSSGYSGIEFLDNATGRTVSIPDDSGWGPAITAGLAYDFQVGKGSKLFASARWVRLARDTETLHVVPLRIGYRFE